MSDYAPGSLRSIAVMRAPTWMERLNDAVRDVYESAAKQPAIRVLDMLGLSDIAGVADDLNRPNTGLRMGIMPEGPGKTLKEIGKGIRAFHGSPHDFEKFDLSKIGTGEGAQAYGHGLYMAEHPDVARGYRDMIPADKRGSGEPMDLDLRIGGKRIEDVYSQMERSAARMSPDAASAHYDKLALLEDLAHEGDVLAVRERAQQGAYSPQALAWFEKEVAPKFTRKGKLYEVRIHADPEQFLDWDKPLSQQDYERLKGKLPQGNVSIPPEGLDMGGGGRVLDNTKGQVSSKPYPYILKSGSSEFGLSGADVFRMIGATNETPTGNQAYTRLTATLGGQDRATAALKEAGFPGIKYLDQGSRAAGEGSRNYVVFDDKLIEIVKKYGIAAALGAGLINEGQARQLQMQGHQ